jgi:putative hydrolase of the HAD superfamily
VTEQSQGLTALVVDFGGVMTDSLDVAMGSWLRAEGIDPESYRTALHHFLGPDADVEDNPVHALEKGELAVPHFEERLAPMLRATDGGPVATEDLLSRMFHAFGRAEDMHDLVRRCRRAGHRTALLSNSWGLDYPRDDWAELYDCTVISGEVGMRKPDVEIYHLTAERLGVRPEECVMVDDLAPNVRGAVAAGMVGVLHRSVEETIAEVEVLLALPPR